MSVLTLKIIACITMFIDHIRYVIPFHENSIIIFTGRIAFPLFAFLISEGYTHTQNLKKYYYRLIVFALISQIPYMLFRTLIGDWITLNIMFTLVLGLSAITAFDKIEKKHLSIPLCFIIIILGDVLKVDYGWFGVALVLMIFVFRNNKVKLCVSYYILLVVYYYSLNMLVLERTYILYFIFCCVPIIFMLLYNGKKGRYSLKYFFYWFYPIHMLIIYLLNFIVR